MVCGKAFFEMHCGVSINLYCSLNPFIHKLMTSEVNISPQSVRNMDEGNITMYSSSVDIPRWASSSVLAAGVLLLILNCAGLSLLLRFLFKSATEDRTPSQTFIVCIAMVSLFGSIVGKT